MIVDLFKILVMDSIQVSKKDTNKLGGSHINRPDVKPEKMEQ